MLRINTRRSGRKQLLLLCALILILFLGKHMKAGAPNVQHSLDEEDNQWFKAKSIYNLKLPHRPSMFIPNRKVGEIRVKDLGKHHYREDGLLEVNPDGPHPIFELIRRGQEEWDTKLRKASRTLEEAVEEYQRRYKRLPPRGFDDWWAYVVKNNIQLPDEYDQIFNDLQPFWGMDPQDLQTIQREWEGHRDSFTIGKDTLEQPISIKNYSLPGDDLNPKGLAKGAYQIMELLEEVQDAIPPFRAVFSPHDNPNQFTDYELKQLALEAARSGTFIDINRPPQVKHDGWTSACSPKSPAWNQFINWGGPPHPHYRPKETKTFIYNHRTAMDPCRHPSHLLLHGQFIAHFSGPVPGRKLVPQFSYSPTMLHHDITTAMPINWVNDIPRQVNPVWDERWDTRLQWRGSNTGIWHGEDTRWDLAQRARLVNWAGDGERERASSPTLGSNVTVLMPVAEGKRVGEGIPVRRVQWAPATLDIAFAAEPINCTPDMCKKLDRIFEFRKRHDAAAEGNYKYYIDVDGNGWSSRFKRIITSNALVFKSTVYPEWYTDRIAPWVHYVPIQNDFSDLWDALVFFRGDPAGIGAYDDMAKKIAEAGRKWSKTFWRQEDLVAYMFRLFLEYSRVMDPERNSLSYEPLKPLPRKRKGMDNDFEKLMVQEP